MFKRCSKLITGSAILMAIILFAAAAVTDVAAQRKETRSLTSVFNAGKIIPSTEILLANPSAKINQCANGSAGSPLTCTGAQWQTGAINFNQGHYLEGDAVPYRVLFENLVANGTYSITVEYDTTEGGRHSLDYLMSYDYTEHTPGNNPCSGVTDCGSVSTFPIPLDPNVSTAGVTQIGGQVFTLWGGTITSVSAYTLTGPYTGTSKTKITINFTADSDGGNAVLAYGGHISTRADWGAAFSAIAINGSNYHMALDAFTGTGVNGNVGSQDLALSAAAVFAPITLQVEKRVNSPAGVSSHPFEFDITGLVSDIPNFTLVDNVAGPNGVFSAVYQVNQQPSGAVGITELETSLWDLDNVVCQVRNADGVLTPAAWTVVTGPNGVTGASLNLTEGFTALCTFTNIFAGPTAAAASVSGQVRTAAGVGIRGALITITDAANGETHSAITNSFGYYSIGGLEVENLYQVNVSSRRYTFANGQRFITLNEDLADMSFTSDQ